MLHDNTYGLPRAASSLDPHTMSTFGSPNLGVLQAHQGKGENLGWRCAQSIAGREWHQQAPGAGRRPRKGQVMIGGVQAEKQGGAAAGEGTAGGGSCAPPLGRGLEGSGECLNETTKQQGLLGKAPAAKDGSGVKRGRAPNWEEHLTAQLPPPGVQLHTSALDGT